MASCFDDLTWRRLIHQSTDPDGLPGLLDAGGVRAYVGFDPTADSLHVGNLQQILLLRRLQLAGHRPIALVGGGTGMIGDPSGKSAERNLLAEDEVVANSAAVRRQLEGYFDTGDDGVVVTDNVEWLGRAGLLEFLRDVGKSFSVNEMVRRDSVRGRLEASEQTLSLTEFAYMALMAWDFLELHDRWDCRMQLGGSDQWGNIVGGVDLIRRQRGTRVVGLTSPLVTKADGTKFGKTEGGTVWLDPARTSPYAFFQFWLRAADTEVGTYLRRFTFLDREAVEAADAATEGHPERREAQRLLAREVTDLVHGRAERERAEAAAAALFTPDIAALDPALLGVVLADAPTTVVSPGELDGGLSLIEGLVRSGIAASRGAARRDIAGGGVYVNNVKAAADRALTVDDVLHGRWVVLRRGRSTQAVLALDGPAAGRAQAGPATVST